MNPSNNKILISILLSVFIGGCSTLRFPGVHRITVQQGNIITQAMIDKLKPGMTKSQVRYVLGNPIIDDSLQVNRWDYVYSLQVPGRNLFQSKLQIFFLEERLSHFEGDFLPSDHSPEADDATDK
jgi:outer membrane protein assembly factor BamE